MDLTRDDLESIPVDKLGKYVVRWCSIIRQDHTDIKFQMVELVNSVLQLRGSSLFEVLKAVESQEWAKDVRIGLMDILKNKISAEHKYNALCLASVMLSELGEKWLARDNDKFVQLLMRTAFVEMHLALTTDSSMENRKLAMVSSCLSILENYLMYLVQGESELDQSASYSRLVDLSPDEILSMHRVFLDTVNTMFDYLFDIQDEYDLISIGEGKKDFCHDERLSVSCLRFLSAYLAEDMSSDHETRLRSILSLVLKLFSSEPYLPTGLYMLPAFVQFLGDDSHRTDSNRRLFREKGGVEVVEKLITYAKETDSGPLYLDFAYEVLNYLDVKRKACDLEKDDDFIDSSDE